VARTREKVLTAGRQLLDDEGPEAVTHLRIGEVTGIARTTIYRHWPDREALLAAVLTESEGRDDGFDRGDLRGDLHAYLEQLRRRTTGRRERHGMAHVMARAEHDRSFADLRRDRITRRLEPLHDLLRRAVERGELPTDLDVDDAAVDLVAPVFFRRFFLGEALSDERIDTLIDTFIDRHGA
jgi:AcrR family transcriptional regulator